MTPQPPPQRQWRVMAALFGLLLASAGGAYFFLLRQDYAVLYQDLREDDAAAIVRALEAQHVRYRLANGGADILVPAAEIDAVRLDIASSDVSINGLEGFELFDQSDMGLTDFAQRIKYQRALQGELARTIMRMDGVVDARVHISIPERTLFRADRRNAEAAVTVVTRRSQDLTPARVEGIRRLVAAAVTDLSSADVVVLDGHGEPFAAPSPVEVANSIAPDPMAELESLARQSVRRAIPYRPFLLAIQTPAPSLDGAAGAPPLADSALTFVLTTESSLTQDERNRVTTEFERAGLAMPDEASPLTFEVGPVELPRPAAPAEASYEAHAATAPQTAATERQQPINLAALALIAAALAAFAFAAWRLLRPTLSMSERRSFADTLQTALREPEEARDGV